MDRIEMIKEVSVTLAYFHQFFGFFFSDLIFPNYTKK